jgi:uncharacterized OB-fold protein
MSELPPFARSAIGAALSDACADGVLRLQRCTCGHLQYPPSEICTACLGDQFRWEAISRRGMVVGWTTAHTSLEPYFRARLPLSIGMIALEAGVRVIAHLPPSLCRTGAAVELGAERDASGRSVLVAAPAVSSRASS